MHTDEALISEVWALGCTQRTRHAHSVSNLALVMLGESSVGRGALDA